MTANQQSHQTQQEEATQRQDTQTAVQEHNDSWDPNQNPFTVVKNHINANIQPQSQLLNPLAQQNQVNLLASGEDSDNDGLFDETEAYWGTCAYALATPEYNNSAYCDGVADPTDSDGDGLSDDAEVNYLNTFPTSVDSDGDSITDTLEVEGFVYNGRTWYLNPNSNDTNGDGQPDNSECNLFLAGALDLTTACGDTNGNGIPDFVDPDNDGDQIPDSEDLSPLNASPDFYGRNNPFLLTLDNLEVDHPVLLDIQLRPQTEEHLQYYNHVLDWPHDNSGQIQRHLNTTWADTANPDYRSDAANAANGDIRLVPMLEVTMPYTDGHYANLPVNSTYYGTSRTLGIPVEDWLEQSVTQPFGMSIDDVNSTTGDLVAYVPLYPVTNDEGTPLGYTTRLIYQPSQSDWGAAHSFRVIWLVQMLTDRCIHPNANEVTCAREDVISVIHTYHETWQLTGLNVSQEYGLDVGLMYENPATDTNLATDDQLWGASWNLGNTFFRGRDCDSYNNGECVSNGQRDVTLANLATNLSDWQLDYTELDTFAYPHQGFMAHIMMTETHSILDTVFTAHANQTSPTILIAQEQHSRIMNLDAASGDMSSGLNLDLSPLLVPQQTFASLSWSTYQYNNGTWQNYEPEAYLDYLQQQLSLQPFFQPEDNSQEAADQAEGKLLWAQMYYSTLLQGAKSVVQVDTTPLAHTSQGFPEANYEDVVPPNAEWGVATIAQEYSLFYLTKWISPAAEGDQFAFFKKMLAGANESPQFTNLNRGGGNSFAMMIIVIAIIGIAVLAVGMITGNESLIRKGVVILAVVTLIVVTYFIALAAVAMVAAFNAGGILFALVVGRTFQGVGVIGFVIGTIISWAVTGILILAQGISGTALGFTLSMSIAGTIVLFIYLILDLIGLGIIVLILVFIDAIFAILDEPGPTQLLTEAIAKTLYGVDILVKNMDDAERLGLDITGFTLADAELGFTINNSFLYSVTVTNTVQYDDGFSFSTLEDKTVFRYFLQDDPIDQEGGLSQGEMVGEWVNLPDLLIGTMPSPVGGMVNSYENQARTTQIVSLNVPLSNIGTGIDQSMDGELYVTESYILPYRGCWKFAGYNTDCRWYKIDGSNHINLGEELIYDVLPQTLNDFVAMNWDDSLPAQVDGDNDGLLSSDGNDPGDSNFDTDGDTLSDYYEIIHGLNPNSADADFDGLNDAEEITYYTNPFNADSDGDDLNDYVEVKQGWLVVYKNYGVSKLTRVWSNPNQPDADGDTLNDREEFVFGFHPQVASDRSAILNLVQFDNLAVTEDTDLRLLYRMEEPIGSEAFFDSSGSGNLGSCDRSTSSCPAAATNGRYAYALSFDGNDYLHTDMALDVQTFTTAAWVYPVANDNGFHGLMGQQATNAQNRAPSVYVTQQTQIHAGFGDGTTWNSFTTGNVLTLNTWQHVATTFDGTTYQVYVNGVEVYNTTTIAGKKPVATTGYNVGYVSNYFKGRLDEVAFLDKALTPTEIATLMNGRYNPNDNILAPGNDLTYQATVTNSSSVPVSGFLVANTSYQEPEVAQPTAAFSFEPDQRLAYFINSEGEENTTFCLDNGTCPTAGINGQIGNAVDFATTDDTLVLPTFDVAENNGSFNLSFWLKADTLPASGQKAMILDTVSTETGAVDIYLNSSGKIVMDIVGDPYSPRVSNYTFGTGWTHVSYASYYSLYINGTLNTSTNIWLVGGNPFTHFKIGYGHLGNSLDGSQHFDGKVDELVYYHRRNTTAITDIRNGNYTSQGEPMILYHFNELITYDGTIFYDSQSGSNHATCSPPTCPILTANGAGFIGRAVTFDGVDDYLTQPGNFTAAETTVTLYAKPTSYPSAGNIAYLYDTQAVGSGTTFTFDLFMDENGKLTVNYGAGSKTYNTVVPLNAWNKIEVIYVRFFSGTWRYQIQLKVNGVLDAVVADVCTNPGAACVSTARVGNGRIGNNLAGTAPFHGLLDELSLHISKLSFDPPLVNLGYDNLANDVRSATCSDLFICPAVTAGKFDQGVAFDGVQTYLDLGPIIDPSAGHFSAAVWFKATSFSNQPIILQQTDGTGATGRTWLGLNTNGTLNSYLGNSILNSVTAVALNTWHHAAVTYDGVTLRLYLDGVLEAQSVRTIEASDGSVWLGRHKFGPTRYFAGTLDELIVLPAAATPAAIQLLMNSTWPIIDVPNLFEPFTATPLTTQEVSGAALVSPYAVTSIHQFDQEVEAALVNTLDYPVIDNNAANLSVFVPFEDTPGTAIFDNLISYPNPNSVDPDVEATCSGSTCPTAGLRGQVDRAAYFDGLDDYLVIDVSAGGYYSWGPDVHSIAVWVNAKQGTILDISDSASGFEVDMNQFRTDNGTTVRITPYTSPRNEWFHLAITVDGGDVSRIYINGVEITNGTNDYIDRPEWIHVGVNHEGQDFLHGYLDDLRTYKTTLAAADVLALYHNSAPLLRFEFDEGGEATVFTDNSVNQYLGQPEVETCTGLDLNSLTINSLAINPSTVFVALDGEWLESETDLSDGAVLTPEIRAVLCEQQTLSVGVTMSDTTTLLGTAVLNATTPGTTNQTFTSGSDSITLNWTVDSALTYQPNPAPGTRGRIGNGALFDGSGAIEIPGSSQVAALTNNFTIMGWIYPEDLAGWQYFLTTSIENSTNGYGFLAHDHDLGFTTLGVKSYYISNVLKNNVWQHVAVVFDINNDATFYLNGVNIGTVSGTQPATVNLDDVMMIGAIRWGSGDLANPPFKGTIDELALYGRSLSTAEINSLYLRELRWYRDRATTYLTVDTDAPTVELLSDTLYRANGYTQLAVATTDATSYVTLLDFGLKAPGDTAFRWVGAPACQDNGIEGAAWCPFFDTSTLGGEGKYEMQFRAVDAVGNQTISPVYIFYVDDTSPTASGNYTGQWGTPTAQNDSGLSWTMTLSGIVNDPNLTTTPAIAGSGVVTNSVLVTLIDETGGLLGEESQLATVNGSTWNIDYRMEGARPQGVYTISLSLEDQVSNQTTVVIGTIQYDEQPSQASLNSWDVDSDIISTTVTLKGAVSDQANWGGEAIQIHFEEPSGATIFHDSTPEENHSTCTNCPIITTGFYGQGAHFDGVNDALTMPNVLNPITNTFSIALWFKADSSGSGQRILVQQADGTGVGRSLFYLSSSNHLASYLGGVDSLANTVVTPDNWHHAALTFDGTTLNFYLDGLWDGTASVTPEAANGGLLLGIHKDLISNPFRGDIDEVVIYRRVLNQLEVSALAQPDASGIQTVQLAVETFDFSSNGFAQGPSLNPPGWQPATVNDAQWSYDLPAATEGFYNIFLRSADNFGNSKDEHIAWRGLIDTVDPVIVASGQQIGGGTAAETEYTFTFSDFLLDESRFVQPCDPGSLVSLTYNDVTLPHEGLPYQVTATCRVPGHETSRQLTTCDTVGHCISATVIPTATTNGSNVVILTPTYGATITNTIPVSVTGGAYDLDGITTIAVEVVDVMVVTITPGVGITDTVWSANWVPLVPGIYTVTVTMTDTLGNSLMDTVQVTVVENTPTAITLVHIGVVPISTPMMFLLLIMLFALLALVVVGSQRRYWPNGQL
ncbi:MAG: hypothetical protein IPL78_11290 [Chloroflexi bacterium]|nr:hypothetical protein [Chloroflexota bacterium]